MTQIILIGMKACGKTTIGQKLADKIRARFIELDEEIEKFHTKIKKEKLPVREIFKKHGENYFRKLETNSLSKLGKELKTNFVLSCGGGTPLFSNNKIILKKLGKIIFLNTDKNELLKRIIKTGIPTFFLYPENPEKSLDELLKQRIPIYNEIAEVTLEISKKTPDEIVSEIIKLI